MELKSLMVVVGVALCIILSFQPICAADLASDLAGEDVEQSACTQDRLEGTWNNVPVWGPDMNNGNSWGQCLLTIDAGGVVSEGSYTNVYGETLKITGGQLAVGPGCIVIGKIKTANKTKIKTANETKIKTANETLYVDRGGFVRDQELVLGLNETQGDKGMQKQIEGDLKVLLRKNPSLEEMEDFVSRRNVPWDLDQFYPAIDFSW